MTLDEAIKKYEIKVEEAEMKVKEAEEKVREAEELTTLLRDMKNLEVYQKIVIESGDNPFTLIVEDEEEKDSMASFIYRCTLSVSGDNSLSEAIKTACLDMLELLRDSIVVWNSEEEQDN